MSSAHLPIGQRVDALSIKVTELQREISMLRRDMQKVLFLLRKEQDDKSGDQADTEPAQAD